MLIVNIKQIAGITDGGTGCLSGGEMLTGMGTMDDAWILLRDGLIHSFGSMSEMPQVGSDDVVDARGGMVLPAFCDSHTHIVYAGSRHGEFIDKINGLSYEDIARRGGGILNSADLLARTSEDELYAQARLRAEEMMAKGTGAMEIKSGYGLSTSAELKMLRVIARLKEDLPAKVCATFLGAHAVGRSYAGRQSEYVEMLVSEMLPAVASEGLADFVDVFCDQGFFTVNETARILEAASKYGMRPKIHANELAVSGGVQVGVRYGAVSVDHLERMGTEEISILKDSTTIPTMLPGASFFLGMPYAPAREAIAAGLPVALASDYNPGSSPSGDMRMVMALGCIKMRLLPTEALAAITVNGAAAMDLRPRYGSIFPGAVANLLLTVAVPSLDFIPYAYTSPFIRRVILQGKYI